MAVVAAVGLCTASASAAEVCHFTGSTDHDGHVEITTNVADADGVIKVDVALTFESTSLFWFHIHYLVEEVSTWRAGVLENVAVNIRYLVGDHIVRQQWDEFQRSAEGLQAHRVQAKTLVDFRRRHPGFVQHWDPATFGQAWLRDYPSAAPERRADLDLKRSPLPSGLRSPLAMAFYWVRWLPRDGLDVPVFLPGFKADRLVDLPIKLASRDDGTRWQVPLRYPALRDTPASTATAWTSHDGHLLQLAFEVHASGGSAQGMIKQQDCQGIAVPPSERR